MKKNIFKKILMGSALTSLMALLACGGGSSSTANNNTSNLNRDLRGSITSVMAPVKALENNLKDLSLSGITIVATDAEGKTLTATTDAQGNFSLALEVGKTYVVSLSQDGNFIGTLLFKMDDSGSFETKAFRMSEGATAVSLGNVSCADGTCRGTLNPLCQVDDDDDGKVDCEDSDDDNDGVRDIDESDDDHDGISDDLEDHSGRDHPEDNPSIPTDDCRVVRLEPLSGQTGVELDERIRVRYSNRINPASVTSAVFEMKDPLGVVIAGQVKVEHSSDDSALDDDSFEIRFFPNALLAPLTQYQVHVSKTVQCENGKSPTEDLNFSFTTGSQS